SLEEFGSEKNERSSQSSYVICRHLHPPAVIQTESLRSFRSRGQYGVSSYEPSFKRTRQMRILLIGATGFIGSYVSPELQSLGHRVCVFHRGKSPVTNAEQIIGDRRCLADNLTDFRRFAPDVVVDLILSSRVQAEPFMNVFRGLARRAVVLSSMDVY